MQPDQVDNDALVEEVIGRPTGEIPTHEGGETPNDARREDDEVPRWRFRTLVAVGVIILAVDLVALVAVLTRSVDPLLPLAGLLIAIAFEVAGMAAVRYAFQPGNIEVPRVSVAAVFLVAAAGTIIAVINGARPVDGIGPSVSPTGTVLATATTPASTSTPLPSSTTSMSATDSPSPPPTIPVTTPSPVIVDERSDAFTREGHIQGWRHIDVGFLGHSYWTRPSSTVPVDRAIWTPDLPVAGHWAIFAYVPELRGHTRVAEYHICHFGQEFVRTIDQSAYSNEWIALGAFDLPAGGGSPDSVVGLNDLEPLEGQYHRISFDAMKWVYVSAATQTSGSGSTAAFCNDPLGAEHPGTLVAYTAAQLQTRRAGRAHQRRDTREPGVSG
jgi:hypothetical protein